MGSLAPPKGRMRVRDGLHINTNLNNTRPQLYHIDLDRSNVLILKLNPEKSPQESLEKIEEVFAKYNPSSPFEYQFVDEGGTRANLEELY